MRRIFRRHDTFTLESAPLHTERPAWAAQAPAQFEAALKRGAHAIGLTEVHGHVATELARLASTYGYHWFHGRDDTALAVSAKVGEVHDASTPDYSAATFQFHGSEVTVFMFHWPTNRKAHQSAREALTAKAVEALHAASAGDRLAFYMGDSNPNGPLSNPSTYPRSALDAAGFPLVYEEVNDFPAHIGVNVIGHAKADGRVTAQKVETFPALGSDHIPAKATYSVKRKARRHRRKHR